ncbi:MAG TPA: HIT domain-containing protein [Candidatus Saccharibacteria bacterium]|nr:histidine triad family protein [Patescibacteria group bacterium]HMS31201.1 HIT domain-containing protein [Candidatus Saccharibacteria bacterium]
MEDSIFTKIIKGEVPCHKVYEDEKVIAFLDIDPMTPGHTLIVPKKQIDNLWELDDETYQYTMQIAKKVACRLQEVLNPKRVGMALEGFAVPHAHIHVFPLEKGLADTTIEHVNKQNREPDHNALAEIAKQLAFVIPAQAGI